MLVARSATTMALLAMVALSAAVLLLAPLSAAAQDGKTVICNECPSSDPLCGCDSSGASGLPTVRNLATREGQVALFICNGANQNCDCGIADECQCSVSNGDCVCNAVATSCACSNANGNCECPSEPSASCSCRNTNGDCTCNGATSCECANSNGVCQGSPGSTGLVLGIVFGILACLCLVAVAAVAFTRRRRRPDPILAPQLHEVTHSYPN